MNLSRFDARNRVHSPSTVLLFLCCSAAVISAFAQGQSPEPAAGTVIVHSHFGGQIFGFDIDQNGSEGLLTEAQTLSNGNTLNAVETFDQKTGKILQVVTKTTTKDQDVTLGVVNNSAGLVEHDHVTGIYVTSRTYRVLNPLSANKFTGTWTPNLAKDDIINQVSRNQSVPNVAVYAFENGGSNLSFVFNTDVAKNTRGPSVTLTDPVFSFCCSIMAYDTKNNRAVLAGTNGAVGGPPPTIAIADLSKQTVTEFTGVGAGFVNGIAVDSPDGIACTSTELDFSVEFYDLARQTGFVVQLPGANNQIFSGADVEFDPIHKLFFVAQPVSSTARSGSSIQVFDSKGNYLKSINGFNFSNASTVIPVHIALKPSTRSGYVDGPDINQIQSFTY